MATYKEISDSREHSIRYRFSCGHCGSDSGWMDHPVRVSHTVRVSGTYDPVAVRHKIEAECGDKLRSHIDYLKDKTAKGYKFDSPMKGKEVYSFNSKCPACGKRQIVGKGGGWEPFWWGFGLAVLGTVPVVLLDAVKDLAVITITLFVVGYVYGFYRRRKAARTQKLPVEVEYDWNGY